MSTDYENSEAAKAALIFLIVIGILAVVITTAISSCMDVRNDSHACWPNVVLSSGERGDVIYVTCAAEDGGTRVVERKR